MSEHTEGVMVVDFAEGGEGYSIWSIWIGKLLVAHVIGNSDATRSKVMRMVECWDACADIKTADLKRGVVVLPPPVQEDSTRQ